MAVLENIPGFEVVFCTNDYEPVDEYEDSRLTTDEVNLVSIRHLIVNNNTVVRLRFRLTEEYRMTLLGDDDDNEFVPWETRLGKLNLHCGIFIHGEFFRRPMIRPCEQFDPRRTPEFFIEIAVRKMIAFRNRKTVHPDGTETVSKEETTRHKIHRLGDVVIVLYRSRTVFVKTLKGVEDDAVRMRYVLKIVFFDTKSLH
jgi:hypothetical protein